MKLNLGSGRKETDGWTGVDVKGPADVIFDLRETPWPWPDNSVEQIKSTHFFQELRWTQVIEAFKECYRIMDDYAEFTICVPDMEKVVRSYLKGEQDLFLAGQYSIPAKLMWQLQWKGSYQSFYNGPLLEEKLQEAGFNTRIVENTNRVRESVTVVAIK